MAETTKGHGIGIEIEKDLEIIKEFNSVSEEKLTRGPIMRELLMIGLDEYAIADKKPRNIPRKGKVYASTIGLKDSVLKEVMDVAKQKKLEKGFAMRYLIFIGFDKFKKDNKIPDNNKLKIELDNKPIDFENLKTTHKAWLNDEEKKQKPVSKSENIPEIKIEEVENHEEKSNQEYFQNIIDLISKSNLKKDSSGSLFDLLKNKKFNFNFSVSIDDI